MNHIRGLVGREYMDDYIVLSVWISSRISNSLGRVHVVDVYCRYIPTICLRCYSVTIPLLMRSTPSASIPTIPPTSTDAVSTSDNMATALVRVT
jgi:hypothetical protein